MRDAPPAVLVGENSGDALGASSALFCWAWGIPAALSSGVPGYALRASSGSFRFFSVLLPESPSRTGGVALFLFGLSGQPMASAHGEVVTSMDGQSSME